MGIHMDGTLLANLIWVISLVAHVAIIVLALIYIPRDRKPTAAMAWLLLIILFPFFGIVFYPAHRQLQAAEEAPKRAGADRHAHQRKGCDGRDGGG